MKKIEGRVTVNGPINDVWKSWTTEEGIRSFFASDCKVEAHVGGAFELYFLKENPVGMRGSESCKFLALEPESMLSFTWNAPPHLPNVRKQFTSVSLYFKSLGTKQTEVTLYQTGWGVGDEWQKCYDYFSKAWLEMVLPNLQKKFN